MVLLCKNIWSTEFQSAKPGIEYTTSMNSDTTRRLVGFIPAQVAIAQPSKTAPTVAEVN